MPLEKSYFGGYSFADKNEAINYLCAWSLGYTKQSLARLWAENSGETIDWYTAILAEGGMEFRHEIDEHDHPSNYPYLEVGHSVQYGQEYYEQLTDVIMATGGYGMNADMMAALQPHSQEMITVNFSKAGAKGDGIKV